MARSGRVRRSITGGYVWKRPNEKVKLKSFHKVQVKALQPTLKQLDMNLQPHVKLHATVKLAKQGEVERKYKKHYGGRNVRVGALTYPHSHRKSVVLMNPKTFNSRAYYHPGGVFTHEVGHLAYSGSSRYKQRKWRGATTPAKKRTRQALDHHEDFAESFRASLKQPITRKNSRYFRVAVDQSRKDHLQKHYLRR